VTSVRNFLIWAAERSGHNTERQPQQPL